MDAPYEFPHLQVRTSSRSTRSQKLAPSLVAALRPHVHQPENRRLDPRRQSVPVCEDREDVQLKT